MGSQPCYGKKERWRMENVCGLHRHKQGMSQRLLPTTRDRLENRIPLMVPFEMFLRRLQGLPSAIQMVKKNEGQKTTFYEEKELNPKKCSFNVEEGPFWGYLITKHGIKANPSKVKAVTDLDQPRTLKDIQSLNGKLAALNRFLSKEKINVSRFLGRDTLRRQREERKTKEVPDSSSKWRLYTDGASNSDRSGAGLMLIDPEGKEYTYALRFEFETTNNEAEYEALLAAKQASIKDYLQKDKTALRGFEDYIVEHVRRNQNKKADALSKLASMTFEHLTKEVLVEVLTKRLIEEKVVLEVEMQERKSWMDPIHEYLLSGLLPEDTREARKIKIQAQQYKLI
ncbi:reverse transcriptase domain-containing protein [Tanacetum coccineum]|uniref:Reverse transcriptase domain-containing protein n=1 Tax=Tanacetum coccineum TaxID=301880 RepID=A0ABQ5FGR8_9ASTR